MPDLPSCTCFFFFEVCCHVANNKLVQLPPPTGMECESRSLSIPKPPFQHLPSPSPCPGMSTNTPPPVADWLCPSYFLCFPVYRPRAVYEHHIFFFQRLQSGQLAPREEIFTEFDKKVHWIRIDNRTFKQNPGWC